MKNILFSLCFGTGSMLYAQTDTVLIDCNMHIDMVKNDAKQFTLTLSHDEKCEIMMDHNTSKIVLISKEHIPALSHQDKETNVTVTESKTDKLISLAKSNLGNS
jgi:hypothetical protein